MRQAMLLRRATAPWRTSPTRRPSGSTMLASSGPARLILTFTGSLLPSKVAMVDPSRYAVATVSIRADRTFSHSFERGNSFTRVLWVIPKA